MRESVERDGPLPGAPCPAPHAATLGDDELLLFSETGVFRSDAELPSAADDVAYAGSRSR